MYNDLIYCLHCPTVQLYSKMQLDELHYFFSRSLDREKKQVLQPQSLYMILYIMDN